MKFFTVIFMMLALAGSFALHAQTKKEDYASQWKKTDELVKKGLTKSALEEVKNIYSLAKKSNNDAQIIKALLYKITLQQNIEEDASAKSIDTLEMETATAREPAKSILQSITAQLYWNYLQQNRYKIYNRTNTVNFNKKDIATWTADDLNKKTGELYVASLKDEKLLQQTNLEAFDAIINKGNVRNLRPSLYDLLAHRALDYFENDEQDVTKPAYAFEINDTSVFAPFEIFIHHVFVTEDSSSLHHKALLIFQKLLAFHLYDANADALIDADIERVTFAHQYGVMENNDALYTHALQNIAIQFNTSAASAQASFLAAQEIYTLALQKNSHNLYTIPQAKEMLDAIAAKFPSGEGGINAKNLINQVVHPTLNLTTEKVNVPGLPFRTLVGYKNFNTLYFRVIAMTPALKKNISGNTDNDEVFQKLVAQQNIRTWKQDLPVINDYKTHTAEIKIDALPGGEYALIGSADDGFSLDKNPLAVQYFYISNISYVNNQQDYFVLDRTTGQPLVNAKVQVWMQQNNYSNQENKLQKGALIVADKNGYCKLPDAKKNDNNYTRLEIFYGKGRLFMDDAQYLYNSYNNDDDDSGYTGQKDYDETNAKIFLFTDRSIYRPGQLIYFKGIGVTKNWKTRKPELLKNRDSITVYLKDANSQKTDSARVVLNEYSSFHGTFHLPGNQLNGEFSIDVSDYENSDISFSVEEYKRPKFYTEFNKAKGSYRLGDSVNITGFAKAYAGNNIDGTKVSYKVTRQARFLYPWIFGRFAYPRTSSLEITHGEMTTDMDGKFVIHFAAIPDLSIDKSTDPVFDYRIEADVTDINGEIRSGNITVPVGYTSLNLQINIENNEIINIDSLKNISVTSKNLSNEPEAVQATVKIYKLQPPERLIRLRFWAQPDTFVISKDQYIQYFPHDEYKDESDKTTWPKSEIFYEKTDSTNKSKFNIQNSKFQQGWYVTEATAKDITGNEVKDVKYFQVYDDKQNSLPSPMYLQAYTKQNSYEPGATARISIASSATNIFLIQQKNNVANNEQGYSKNQSSFFYTFFNNKKIFDYPIIEDDRGGFGVTYIFVKDNRFYTSSNNIIVPWSNKDLNISFETFHNKTLPGSEEKWTVKVSGNKGEKVSAEMLASMYDASLDQFETHNWQGLNVWPTYSENNNWQSNQSFSSVNSLEKYWQEKYIQPKEKNYDVLNYLPGNYFRIRLRGMSSAGAPGASSQLYGSRSSNLDDVVVIGYGTKRDLTGSVNKGLFTPPKVVKDEEVIAADSTKVISHEDQSLFDPSQIQIRKNFNETAFFYPDLRTDSNGNIKFCFTMPEALTQWKLMALAHTKDLASGYATKTIVTQKDLMVQPDVPRFLRQGDSMELSVKIVNLTSEAMNGTAKLQLLYASSMMPANDVFKNINALKPFAVAANQSAAVKFTIAVPANFNDAVVYKIVAQAGSNSDGEEAAIPVVTNRMLVTETMPLPMRCEGTKHFTFEKLLHSASSSTLKNYALSVEYTTNPAWYAVQALPYLMEYPYECAEQTFNRYYANAVAAKIVHASPKIKDVFTKWATADTDALMSNLQKNEELKSVLLQETPWVLQSQSEAQQKKNIALLFNMVRMSLQLQSAMDKLTDMQSANGGFAWFKGGTDDRYITQYIVTGIGHLQKLQALQTYQQNDVKNILDKAIPYLDKLLKKDYDDLVKYKIKLSQDNLSTIAIQYLYMRSFFPDYPISKQTQTAFSYYQTQAKKYWLNQNKYMQAMIALSLYRTNNKVTAQSIISSLKENAINNEELGMYWKEWNSGGYWWYQAPVESQAMMIEAFSEIDKDEKTIDDLKTWLLKNKQTNNWKTTKATADACYAMLLQGTDWLSEHKNVVIKLGDTSISSTDQKQEDGSGYFKIKINSNHVQPAMGNIVVNVSSPANQLTSKPINNEPSWGSVYWQYFEDLDKITFSETPLKLSKKLFIQKNTDRGPVLQPINNGDQLHVGDKIKVRIELRADRDMEYVHMKDMRASCMEPTNVLSEYKYQDGLGYYETTKDVSTNFFFDHLTKGTYVFEYPMFVTQSGNFSNGITTIQCMYAPEFTAHSEGIRVQVK